MGEMTVTSAIEIGCPDGMKEALEATQNMDLGTLGDMEPVLEIYKGDECADIHLTVKALIAEMPKLDEIEAVLKRVESTLRQNLQSYLEADHTGMDTRYGARSVLCLGILFYLVGERLEFLLCNSQAEQHLVWVLCSLHHRAAVPGAIFAPA